MHQRDVFFEMSMLEEGHFTNDAGEFFLLLPLATMHCHQMSFQMALLRKGFVTKVTLKVSSFFMLGYDVGF